MTVAPISCDELRAKIERGDHLVLVDALPPMSFAHSHLPGAINLPPARVNGSVAKRLPDRDAEIVVYCANEGCTDSVETARALHDLGYTNLRHYPGGKNEWRERGFPLERAGVPLDVS